MRKRLLNRPATTLFQPHLIIGYLPLYRYRCFFHVFDKLSPLRVISLNLSRLTLKMTRIRPRAVHLRRSRTQWLIVP